MKKNWQCRGPLIKGLYQIITLLQPIKVFFWNHNFRFEWVVPPFPSTCSITHWYAHCHKQGAESALQIMFCLPYKHFGSPTLKIWQTMRTSRIVILLLHHHEYEYCRMECVCISYKLGICFCHRTKLRSGLTMLAIDAVALVTTSNGESHTASNLETFFVTICEHTCCWKIGVIESQQTGTK